MEIQVSDSSDDSNSYSFRFNPEPTPQKNLQLHHAPNGEFHSDLDQAKVFGGAKLQFMNTNDIAGN